MQSIKYPEIVLKNVVANLKISGELFISGSNNKKNKSNNLTFDFEQVNIRIKNTKNIGRR